MRTLRSATIATALAAVLAISGGAALADDSDNVCVWSEALQRWVCVPPE